MVKLLGASRHAVARLRQGDAPGEVAAALEECGAQLDVDFVEAEVPTALAQSKEGIERVATIVRAMKAFGRPDPSDPEPTDVDHLVANAITVARNELKYVAEVTEDFGAHRSVRCFPGAISQVVLNLLVNAAYAVGEAQARTGERGHIGVKTWAETDRVAISVSDTGTGIPASVLPRIFQPFFTTKPFGRGTGQGLAMAWATVVDRHRGQIEVATSELGTTFTVTLPVVAAPDGVPAGAERPSAGGRMTDNGQNGGDLKILFVDDDPNVLAGLRRMLHAERERWDTRFAIGAEAALALLENCDFDVVVSDMKMPGMDGADLLVRVRELNPSTVRIVLSGQTERVSAVKAARVAHQFLNKPTDAQALKNAVGRARELERRLGQTRLRSALGRMESLPSPSRTVQALHLALADPLTDVDRVVSIVEPDLGISSKLLQLVNSAFFALPREVVSLHEAVAYLGLENVRAVATSVDLFDALGTGANAEKLALRLQAHSLGVMQLAQHLLPGPAGRRTCSLVRSCTILGCWPPPPCSPVRGPSWATKRRGGGPLTRNVGCWVPPTPTSAPTCFASGACPTGRSRSSIATTTRTGP